MSKTATTVSRIGHFFSAVAARQDRWRDLNRAAQTWAASQAGGDASEVVLVALTERGITSVLSTSAKLGADVGVALGPVGAGAEAATANLSADIVSYSRAKGLFAGMSVEGAVVTTRGSLNTAYYGRDVSPTDILIRRTVSNPEAAGLIEALNEITKNGQAIS